MGGQQMNDESVTAERVTDEAGRRRVIEVLRATYLQEKRWVDEVESQMPADDLDRSDVSWFVVTIDGGSAGVLRVLYDPPLAAYAQYGFKLLDPNIRVEDFIAKHRIAEIGRFAVLPEYRKQVTVAAALMRVAADETIARGYTHFVTDVFEDDPHSPYGFHTRVMGFFPVATHEVGELHCRSRRITLVLDLKAAYRRLQRRGNWLFHYLTGRWDGALHERMAA
jgi:hypothetical protein